MTEKREASPRPSATHEGSVRAGFVSVHGSGAMHAAALRCVGGEILAAVLRCVRERRWVAV